MKDKLFLLPRLFGGARALCSRPTGTLNCLLNLLFTVRASRDDAAVTLAADARNTRFANFRRDLSHFLRALAVENGMAILRASYIVG